MRTLLFISTLLCCNLAMAVEPPVYTYEGPWKTVNRPLDGNMTAVVTNVELHKWKGRFYGVWQGVQFDYTVDFTGPPENLRGVATIDGASYNWKGRLSKKSFTATFDGSRYNGSFTMRRK